MRACVYVWVFVYMWLCDIVHACNSVGLSSFQVNSFKQSWLHMVGRLHMFTYAYLSLSPSPSHSLALSLRFLFATSPRLWSHTHNRTHTSKEQNESAPCSEGVYKDVRFTHRLLDAKNTALLLPCSPWSRSSEASSLDDITHFYAQLPKKACLAASRGFSAVCQERLQMWSCSTFVQLLQFWFSALNVLTRKSLKVAYY